MRPATLQLFTLGGRGPLQGAGPRRPRLGRNYPGMGESKSTTHVAMRFLKHRLHGWKQWI
jgi:hypothetical protein